MALRRRVCKQYGMRLAVFALAPLLISWGPLTKPSLERVCGIYKGALNAHPNDVAQATAFVNVRRDSIYNKDRGKTAASWDSDVLTRWTTVVASEPGDRVAAWRTMAVDAGHARWTCPEAEKLFTMQAAGAERTDDLEELPTSTTGFDTLAAGNNQLRGISDAVQKNRTQIRGCYENVLKQKPSLEGVVKVRFTITADGSVTDAKVAESTLKDGGVEKCLVGQVKQMKFPKPKAGKATVTYPFSFKRSS